MMALVPTMDCPKRTTASAQASQQCPLTQQTNVSYLGTSKKSLPLTYNLPPRPLLPMKVPTVTSFDQAPSLTPHTHTSTSPTFDDFCLSDHFLVNNYNNTFTPDYRQLLFWQDIIYNNATIGMSALQKPSLASQTEGDFGMSVLLQRGCT